MTAINDATGLFTHETGLDGGTAPAGGLGSFALVGRASDCSLVLADDTVSPMHAKVTFRSAWVDVEDLGSNYGTRINGVEVEGIMPAPVGARVQFGRVERVVVMSADGSCATLTDPDPVIQAPAATETTTTPAAATGPNSLFVWLLAAVLGVHLILVLSGLNWVVAMFMAIAANTVLCYLDSRQDARISDEWFWGGIFVPVYLYKRNKALGVGQASFATYLAVWGFTFLLSLAGASLNGLPVDTARVESRIKEHLTDSGLAIGYPKVSCPERNWVRGQTFVCDVSNSVASQAVVTMQDDLGYFTWTYR